MLQHQPIPIRLIKPNRLVLVCRTQTQLIAPRHRLPAINKPNHVPPITRDTSHPPSRTPLRSGAAPF
ncbi:hypothetical protein GCM10009804_54900 [Kribbella hippodromi]|uniref:Uncharacterized protein n=1 Tax=Kribbella hippodromi TaxID=434347 RepID=A0ABN2DZM0_9ACTN